MMTMTGAAFAGLDRMDSIIPAVQQLGESHTSYGVKNEHYPIVGHALLWTQEQGLVYDWNAELLQPGVSRTRFWQIPCRRLRPQVNHSVRMLSFSWHWPGSFYS